jgi:hypothetical protein
MFFTYAKLSPYDFGYFRFLGHGLGNLLFPWARAMVFSRKNDLPPIWPTWPQIKLGPLLRREADRRFYHDLFAATPGYVTGYKKIMYLMGLPHIPEHLCANGIPGSARRGVVIFSGMDSFFNKILPDHALVREELLSITRPEHKKGLAYDFRDSLAMHVRLGDFSSTPDPAVLRQCLKAGMLNVRLPLQWYVSVLKKIRQVVGTDRQVYIFSDGHDAELAELLELPHCQRLTFGSSIADLLALSRVPLLVASGSTFSMWASYLGRMPTIWFPGQLQHRLYTENTSAEIEMDFHDELPASFLEELAKTCL